MKPDCYKCKHRGGVTGSVHSSCHHPKVDSDKFMKDALIALLGGEKYWMVILGVSAEQHGIDEGWFMWPLNFDPIWLKTCNGYEVIK
jgi:hypothetical protein